MIFNLGWITNGARRNRLPWNKKKKKVTRKKLEKHEWVSVVCTWKNPQSLQARWSLASSDSIDSWSSNLCISTTGISLTEARLGMIVGWSWSGRIYLGGMAAVFTLANSWTQGTIRELPSWTTFDSMFLNLYLQVFAGF